MINQVVGILVIMVVGLSFAMFTTDQGVTKGGQELGQKLSIQVSQTQSDPNNGTASVPKMSAGTSSVMILK